MDRAGGWLSLADPDVEDGSFHGGVVPGLRHHGFDRDALQAELSSASSTDTSACAAHTMSKTVAGGRVGQYPLVLITARA